MSRISNSINPPQYANTEEDQYTLSVPFIPKINEDDEEKTKRESEIQSKLQHIKGTIEKLKNGFSPATMVITLLIKILILSRQLQNLNTKGRIRKTSKIFKVDMNRYKINSVNNLINIIRQNQYLNQIRNRKEIGVSKGQIVINLKVTSIQGKFQVLNFTQRNAQKEALMHRNTTKSLLRCFSHTCKTT